MTLVALTQKVKRNLELIFVNTNMIKAKKINNQKMLEIANSLRAELPGCGFAVLAFNIENNETCSNYVSNVEDEFMINALEMQLTILKNKKAVSAS
jgi:hypothetical protein